MSTRNGTQTIAGDARARYQADQDADARQRHYSCRMGEPYAIDFLPRLLRDVPICSCSLVSALAQTINEMIGFDWRTPPWKRSLRHALMHPESQRFPVSHTYTGFWPWCRPRHFAPIYWLFHGHLSSPYYRSLVVLAREQSSHGLLRSSQHSQARPGRGGDGRTRHRQTQDEGGYRLPQGCE